MLKSDRWIRSAAAAGMIEPFVPYLVREVEGRKVLSYGCSSYGYDLTLSAREFFIFRHVPGRVIDPKNFSADSLERAPLHFGNDGSRFFIIPGHSYGLGVAREKLVMPPNVTGVCVGKSTYARCAIAANITPAEAGWEGYLTLEIANNSPADVRVYADEGIVQVLFFESDACETSYLTRNGKYQGQGHEVTLARI